MPFPDLISPEFILTYGYWAVAGLIALESMGIPLPGETALITAAVLAGATHDLNIVLVIGSAAAGAIVGDSIGFWIGHGLGARLLTRYGSRVGLTEQRLKLGRYLFLKYGGRTVFFGRFIAILRTLTALLAGASKMPWPKFLLFNAAGGIVWASAYGLAAYLAGELIHRISGPLSFGFLALGAVAVMGGAIFLRRHEQSLVEEAERAFPGSLE